MNADYASTRTERANRDDGNRATVTISNHSATNDNNLFNDDNNIENAAIARDEGNVVINTFINSEGRIEGIVKENLKAAIMQGHPAQGYLTSLNDVHLNNNVGWRKNNMHNSRPHSKNWSNNTGISISQRSRWSLNLHSATLRQHKNTGNRTNSDSSNFG